MNISHGSTEYLAPANGKSVPIKDQDNDTLTLYILKMTIINSIYKTTFFLNRCIFMLHTLICNPQ